ncbi:TetR/AcrR family transcriptional regulator [Mycobacterium sp. DL440]|uniref:TetR/AcrR family transcriptional regulator n=1 Tax=Mycobacterium sp. DL440 TaxID=2675523 RepID=UPI00141DA693|nr:TetR family transcriptional regulator [Mycobacterium sp. DL440]
MSKANAPTKADRGNETRELILGTAERLFAERGVTAVSNRQISDAAGQFNNFVVGYHFGTKTDLVLAIARRHNAVTEGRRQEMLTQLTASSDLREWVACLIKPVTEHLAAMGNPSWYARFAAQITTDPALRQIVIDEAVASPSMQQTIDGISQHLSVLPEQVRQERADMSRQLLVHTCAERERALHDGRAVPRATWEAVATGLIDATAGLWLAPFTATS